MMLFLDTEFTRLPDKWQSYSAPSLISIGMISDDGAHSFYAELEEGESWHRAECSQFVLDNVLPILTGPAMTRQTLQKALRDWFATLPNDLTIAIDYDLDYEFLKAALGSPLPSNLPSIAFKVNSICDGFVYDVEVSDFFAPGVSRHHSKHDADALRRAYIDWKAKQ